MGASQQRWKVFFGGAAAFSVLLVALFPGDISFVNDEAVLLEKVWAAREAGVWWIEGLKSFSGVHYGPLPLFVYRLFLELTPNPLWWVVFKSVGGQLLVGGALWVAIARLGLSPWAASFALFSPYLYLYQRALWDNCFLVPLSIVTVVCLVRFLQEERTRHLIGFAVAAVLMVHVHLMCGLLLLPSVVGLFWFRRPALLRPTHLAVVAVSLLLCVPYGLEVLNAPRGGGYSGAVGPIEALGAAVTGARVLSFPEFFSYFFPGVFDGLTGWVLRLVLIASFFLVGLAGWGVWIVIQRPSPDPWQFQWERIALLTLAVVFLVHWSARIKFHPHYANATWPVYLWFLSRGWQSPPRWVPRKLFPWSVVAQGGALIGFVLLVHVKGGDRGARYGATLGNQLSVVRSLGQQKPSNVEVENYRRFPHTLEFLQRRFAPRTGRRSSVHYRDAGGSGWLESRGDRD